MSVARDVVCEALLSYNLLDCEQRHRYRDLVLEADASSGGWLTGELRVGIRRRTFGRLVVWRQLNECNITSTSTQWLLAAALVRRRRARNDVNPIADAKLR